LLGYLVRPFGLTDKDMNLECKGSLEDLTGMRFDVVIGNPPYQEMDQSQDSKNTNKSSATAIYDEFHELGKQLDAQHIIFVVPSKCLAGGKGLDGFRKDLQSGHVRKIILRDASEWFRSGSEFNGPPEGHIIYHWDSGYIGNAQFSTETGSLTSPDVIEHEIEPGKYDIIPRDPADIPIIHKVTTAPYFSPLKKLVRKPYGLPTNFFKGEKYGAVQVQSHSPGQTVMCAYGSDKKTWELLYKPVAITQVPKNVHTIPHWKVITSKALGRVDGTSKVFLLPPGKVCTETYLVLRTFGSETEAINCQDVMGGAFMQFMICTRKVTQDIVKALAWVPELDWTRPWTDDEIFESFNLTADERAHVLKKMEKVVARHRGYGNPKPERQRKSRSSSKSAAKLPDSLNPIGSSSAPVQ
jgi:site-specific DNA-methyltransferase (adenine-specific)